MSGGPHLLADHLRRRIERDGPLTVAQYMEDCLGHPELGYYMTRDPLGRGGDRARQGGGGDFTTAPEVSQMFGELLGLWAAVVWQQMGEPEVVTLAELGPGRGTLMADALRAARGVAGFAAAFRVVLVEISPVLKRRQRDALGGHAVSWVEDPSQLPEGPLIVLANEFLDTLPVRQFVRTVEGWRERRVDWRPGEGDQNGRFGFVLGEPGPAPAMLPDGLKESPMGEIVEVAPAALRKVHTLADRFTHAPGAALFIDYGHAKSAPGDTFQAVKGHAYHPPLMEPGEADLTAHVDFEQVARVAGNAGGSVHGPVTQGAFLGALGIAERARALLKTADPRQGKDIESALRRLTAPDGMGHLFKVLAVTSKGAPVPPGFVR